MDAPRAAAPVSGFTLLELLVALAVLGVVSAAVAPQMRALGASSKLNAFTNGFHTHLHLARSEAIKRRGPVTLCKSVHGSACASTGGWEQGWIVFRDRNGDGLRTADEPVLERAGPLQPGYRLRGNLNVARYLLFTPSGATRTASGAFQAGTLTICRRSAGPSEARQIVINAVGRARQQKVRLASCD